MTRPQPLDNHPQDDFTVLRLILRLPVHHTESSAGGSKLQCLEACFHRSFAPDPAEPIPLHFSSAVVDDDDGLARTDYTIVDYDGPLILPTPTPPGYIHEVSSVIDLSRAPAYGVPFLSVIRSPAPVSASLLFCFSGCPMAPASPIQLPRGHPAPTVVYHHEEHPNQTVVALGYSTLLPDLIATSRALCLNVSRLATYLDFDDTNPPARPSSRPPPDAPPALHDMMLICQSVR
ncbi:hypothetical protein ColLi_09067 [Colletotrichum liriopes]|uniref:Uncharacterized protein n=1 Tax=Colletotrichum liriopes TaxID=708192 RepID=A0AA37LVE8_9PEZI|nr:hypothetical protein ColLi_09067 [Colletotrichum liriopes]